MHESLHISFWLPMLGHSGRLLGVEKSSTLLLISFPVLPETSCATLDKAFTMFVAQQG